MVSYIELHAHSCFSLLDGASPPEALVERAALLGMDVLALTDHDAVYGAVRFVQAARRVGLRPILGAELTLHDHSHLTLLVADATGWSNLCQLITLARHNAPKGEARLPEGALQAHTDGLIALSGCRNSQITRAIRRRDKEAALTLARQYADWFGRDRFYIELQHHLLPGDGRRIAASVALAERASVGVVATNNVHYAERHGAMLHDVLRCIRYNTTLDDAGTKLHPNSERYLKAYDKLAPLFARCPDALTNTRRIASDCTFELDFGLQTLPTFPTPDGMSAETYLAALCRDGLPPDVAAQLEYELAVIHRCGLSNYFLIVWDIVRFAREQGIRCQGRGSAANSLVAFALGISPINPLDHKLVFERFLSDDRQVVPDIDIDFDAARREEVIQYVYGKYGHDHAAMACTFVTFRARSALRDVGKALGLPPDALDKLEANPLRDGVLSFEPRSHPDVSWGLLASLCSAIDGLPRHLSIHNGGMVVTGTPIAARLPTEPATMPDRYVVQWDKDSLEDAGLVKIDILGLRMLSAISDAVDQIGVDAPANFDDPSVYQMVTEADTIGVFQVESRAQAQVLPRLQPRTFNDIIVSISLIRPGPVQGNMVHPYLRRRIGQEAVAYAHPLLEPALSETLGVILFQEQVIKTARDLAGFSAGQGEVLRRALGSKRPDAAVEALREAFIAGALVKGVSKTTADFVFDTLRAFGGYSFPKSHAAAFAVLVYQSAWLKRYHPAAFYCGLLNNQPMGFWSPAVIVGDAKRHGIKVLPVHVNHSAAKCTVVGGHVRLGLSYVKGLGEDAERIVESREEQLFTSLSDFCRRVPLPRRLIENLILAGALDGWGESRRALLWELGGIDLRPDTLPLVMDVTPDTAPELDLIEAQSAEYGLLGLTTGEHPMAFHRATMRERGVLDSGSILRINEGLQVEVAGLLVVHQAPPTAKGFHFLILEDEFGFFNIIVRPKIYAAYRTVVRGSTFLHVIGQVQREGAVVNVLAATIRQMTH